MGRLFGTDGARGIANKELTAELAASIGKAAALVLSDGNQKSQTVLIGKDTRLSGDMLEGALISGLCSCGFDVLCVGVVPTPAVAFLVRKFKASAGIMISASHNPYEYNGIKIFSSDGYKLPDALEEKIESIIFDENTAYPEVIGDKVGKVIFDNNAVDLYVEHIISSVSVKFDGIKVAIDCSNGSSSRTAEKLFKSLGADCIILNDSPNGININENCGSTHIENMAEFVIKNKCDLGVAFDGDADRCLAVDENGRVIDGDIILAVCAKALKEKNLLKKDTVVGTIMSNMGLSIFCKQNNFTYESTKVGDRYVLEKMLTEGYNLGGEQSGHVIFLDYGTTGDGQLTAVQLLSILAEKKQKMSDLANIIKKYPQSLINVKITSEGKLRFYTDDIIKERIERAKQDLGEDGRVLVRVSGTEPLIRVMVEGSDTDKINIIAKDIAQLIKDRLGA